MFVERVKLAVTLALTATILVVSQEGVPAMGEGSTSKLTMQFSLHHLDLLKSSIACRRRCYKSVKEVRTTFIGVDSMV